MIKCYHYTSLSNAQTEARNLREENTILRANLKEYQKELDETDKVQVGDGETLSLELFKISPCPESLQKLGARHQPQHQGSRLHALAPARLQASSQDQEEAHLGSEHQLRHPRVRGQD